jgi:hypothetical protein
MNVLNIVLTGYVLISLNEALMHMIPAYIFPSLLIGLVFFGVSALLLQKKDYLFLILSSFTFLTFYFAIIKSDGLNLHSIWLTWLLNIMAIKLYYLLLLPALFFTNSLDFFLLAKDLGKVGKMGYLRYFIPILIKRELILHRYNKIMETLWMKGYNSRGMFGRLSLLHMWMIPLIVTTILEGAESYEYNQMLQTKIADYTPTYQTHYISKRQKVLFTFLMLCLISFITWSYV